MKCSHIVTIVSFMLGTVILETPENGKQSAKDLTSEPGHLKPFGSGRPSRQIDTVDGFPDQRAFLTDYVFGSKPLKMTGAAKLSPAFTLWTDDYFLSLDLPEDSTVHLETIKKESRDQNTEDMKFQDFIKIYNKTEHYMVDGVPEYLGGDLVFPCAVQCTQLMEESVVTAMMWFSSGGTKSVVHADAVDNINCLYRGNKTFIMVDTNKYRDKVDLDHPEGLYSSMDVDRVDYTKFPGMAEVEFFHVNMVAGDCLFIPYRWFHQVRSFGSNLAVNIWWDHYSARSTDLDTCGTSCDHSIKLNSVKQHGMDSTMSNIGSIKDHLINTVAVRSIDLDGFKNIFAAEMIQTIPNEESKAKIESVYNELMDEFFRTLDVDADGLINTQDLITVPEQAWWDAQTYIAEVQQLFGREDGEDEDLVTDPEDFHDEL
ncbi:LOW QUALITY PROTEIN: tRNA wybutosine-synthesizing protein 5-like [Haliotis rubra]|uniref:LOW QUALITY PROTEIN: tRNA wybutosine-synthesizing protein 5-like n=1 Tax=Haliotis rubra TaxID=36100 RepID=UPI001EE4ED51|nr:LOW QUALITY PROTEIN: tRNA wybutosine-synthesizing protein 5-like [Haliotis rubra]